MIPAVKTSSKRPTIYDLAQLAGASPSAVSAVLSGSWKKRRISEKTAQRVMRIAEEQGYATNIQASMLRRERSKIIGMMVPKYDNRYFGEMAEKFEEMARARGLFPVITCTQRDLKLESVAAKELLAYQVSSLVVTGATDPDHIATLCAAAGVPTINLDLPGTRAPSVLSDNYTGARRLAEHMLDQVPGTQPLLFIGGRSHDHNTSERLLGVKDAHAARGISLPEENIITSGYAPEKAEEVLHKRTANGFSGIFVNSTITLEGVVRWRKTLPQDARDRIQFGCFDWDPFAALLEGNIGMVRQDSEAMLKKVFELLGTPTEAAAPLFVDCLFIPLGTPQPPPLRPGVS